MSSPPLSACLFVYSNKSGDVSVSSPPLPKHLSSATTTTTLPTLSVTWVVSPVVLAARMESNKDEALKCLAIAQKHRNAGNYPSAKRFCQKSISLFSTAEAIKLLGIIEVEARETTSETEASSSQAGPSASSSAAEAHPSAAGARQRHHAAESKSEGKAKANGDAAHGPPKKSYTPENLAVVNRVRACKVTEYYEILSLKRDCDEAEVKKAYRKVSPEAYSSARLVP